MKGPLSDESTAKLLADAMRAEVDTALPPPTLVSGLPARAARRRRARLTALGVVASVALTAGVLSIATGDPAPQRPTALPPTSPPASESPQPAVVSPARMEATSLPPGFMFWNTGPATTRPTDGSEVWPRAVTYARGFTDAGKPRTPIVVTTTVDAVDEIDLGDFDDPEARWVTVGGRRVVHAAGAGRSRGYHWTHERGVNVSVTAGQGVTDTELRHIVVSVRLITPAPAPAPAPGTLTRLEPDSGAGVLHAEIRGRGSRTIGPIAVPATFDVHTACDGKTLRVQIGTLRDTTWECEDPDTPLVEVVDRTNGVRSVTITLTADSSTTWAILVTTSAGHP